MRLGELMTALEREGHRKPVFFDALRAIPTKFDSYRGYYEDLALGFDGRFTAPDMTVGTLIELCRCAIGSTFQGWKGGNYAARPNTRLWACNRGLSNGFEIVGVESNLYEVILKTEKTE